MKKGMKVVGDIGWRIALALFVLYVAAGSAHAQSTFNKYGPVAGIQKNTGSTFQDTAAGAGDVIALWSGTADAAHCLSGAATLVSCTGGGGGSPGGASNSAQYNNSGAFGGVALAADTVLQGSAGAPQALSLPNCGSSTQALSYSTSSHTYGCQTISGGGGSPGGSNTQIQFNNSGAFGGDADFTWDDVGKVLTMADLTSFNAQAFVTFAAPSTSNGANVIISGTFSGALFANGSSGYGQVGCPSCLNGTGSTIDLQIQTFDSASSVVLSGGEGDSTASFNNLAIKLGDTTGTTVISGYGLSAADYVDVTPDFVSVTWSFQTAGSSCTVNGTNATVKLHKIGKVVTGNVTSAGTCTISSGASVTTTGGPVPTGFRPTASVACGVGDVTLSAGGEAGWICVSSSGNLLAQRLGTTATTTIGVGGGNSFTYTLD